MSRRRLGCAMRRQRRVGVRSGGSAGSRRSRSRHGSRQRPGRRGTRCGGLPPIHVKPAARAFPRLDCRGAAAARWAAIRTGALQGRVGDAASTLSPRASLSPRRHGWACRGRLPRHLPDVAGDFLGVLGRAMVVGGGWGRARSTTFGFPQALDRIQHLLRGQPVVLAAMMHEFAAEVGAIAVIVCCELAFGRPPRAEGGKRSHLSDP